MALHLLQYHTYIVLERLDLENAVPSVYRKSLRWKDSANVLSNLDSRGIAVLGRMSLRKE